MKVIPDVTGARHGGQRDQQQCYPDDQAGQVAEEKQQDEREQEGGGGEIEQLLPAQRQIRDDVLENGSRQVEGVADQQRQSGVERQAAVEGDLAVAVGVKSKFVKSAKILKD